MSRITIDVSRWPLFLATYPPTVTEADLTEFYVAWQVEMEKRGRHAVLIDVRRMNPLRMSATLRKHAANEVEKRRPFFERYNVGEARVVDSAPVRMIVTAFDWLVGSTFKHPIRNLGSMAEAEAWLIELLAKERLAAVPPRAGGCRPPLIRLAYTRG